MRGEKPKSYSVLLFYMKKQDFLFIVSISVIIMTKASSGEHSLFHLIDYSSSLKKVKTGPQGRNLDGTRDL